MITLEQAVVAVLVDLVKPLSKENDHVEVARVVLDVMTSAWQPITQQLVPTGLLLGTMLTHGENIQPLDHDGEPGDLLRWRPRAWSKSYDLRVVGVLG
jgi:hypothetical protein